MFLNFLSPKWGSRLVFLWVVMLMTGLAMTGCGGNDGQPDVDDVKITLKSQRLDKDLAAIDTNHIGAGLQQLQAKYPGFLNFYLDTLMGFGVNGNFADTNKAIEFGVKSFLTHKDYRGLFDTVVKHYPDTKKIEEPLQKGFQYLKHYYPDHYVPQIIYLVSGLNNWGAFTVDTSYLGIGLDMFLGEQYPYYASVGIPDYKTKQLKEEYIPVAVFSTLYQQMHPFVMDGKTLLDMMLQRGGEQYFLEKVIPFVPEHVRLGYTQAQLKWCQDNEALVYNFFVKEDILYSTDWQKILRFVHDAPTSAGMPSESPGNIGAWLGLQIIRSYAQQHSDATLPEIVKDKNVQQFLQQSKYKPK